MTKSPNKATTNTKSLPFEIPTKIAKNTPLKNFVLVVHHYKTFISGVIKIVFLTKGDLEEGDYIN